MGDRQDPPGAAPDFTSAFLVSFGVVVFMALCAIWAIWGLVVACLVGALGDRVIRVEIGRRR